MSDDVHGPAETLTSPERLTGRELALVRPSRWHREYELRGDDALVGRLRWPRALRQGAEAEAADGRWRFRPSGFLRRTVGVGDDATGAELGTLRRGGLRGDGTIVLNDQSLELRRRSWWKSDWAWHADGPECVRLHSRQGRERRVELELEPAAGELPRLALLLMLGCYLVIANDDEAAAAAGA